MDLLKIRIARGYTMKQAADEVGIHRDIFRKAEHGIRISPRNAKRIADWYGIDIFDLIPLDRWTS